MRKRKLIKKEDNAVWAHAIDARLGIWSESYPYLSGIMRTKVAYYLYRNPIIKARSTTIPVCVKKK